MTLLLCMCALHFRNVSVTSYSTLSFDCLLYSYLHASAQHTYGRPIAGQKEISGSRTQSQGNLWKAMEGVYMEPEQQNTL